MATVTPASGTTALTGTVDFLDGATSIGIGTGTLSTSGGVTTATFSISTLDVGPHLITAKYIGDTSFTGSTSTPLIQTVNQDETTTTVSSSVNPSAFGQSVTFTATVSVNSRGAGTPTGTVTFEDGGVALPNGTVNLTTVGGQQEATYTTSALSVATHSITAVYNGDTNDLTSTSSALTETVNQNQTTTSVSVSTEYLIDNQAVPLGQEVTLAATVTANESTVVPPAGSTSSTARPSSAPPHAQPRHRHALNIMLVVGAHTIRADYHGDGANFAGSTSEPTDLDHHHQQSRRRWDE